MRFCRREEGERDLRHVGFFAPQACPERRVDHRLDRGFVRDRLDGNSVGAAVGVLMCGEMRVNPRRHHSRHRVRTFAHAFHYRFEPF